jgi:hypothetical protein
MHVPLLGMRRRVYAGGQSKVFGRTAIARQPSPRPRKASRRNRSEADRFTVRRFVDGAAMYDAADFRKRAQDCMEQAEDASKSASEQLALLRKAAMLLELADEAECINRLMAGAKPHLDS